jgi:fatty acid-binding protein DegV
VADDTSSELDELVAGESGLEVVSISVLLDGDSVVDIGVSDETSSASVDDAISEEVVMVMSSVVVDSE